MVVQRNSKYVVYTTANGRLVQMNLKEAEALLVGLVAAPQGVVRGPVRVRRRIDPPESVPGRRRRAI
jgi:hypothetical protein